MHRTVVPLPDPQPKKKPRRSGASGARRCLRADEPSPRDDVTPWIYERPSYNEAIARIETRGERQRSSKPRASEEGGGETAPEGWPVDEDRPVYERSAVEEGPVAEGRPMHERAMHERPMYKARMHRSEAAVESAPAGPRLGGSSPRKCS